MSDQIRPTSLAGSTKASVLSLLAEPPVGWKAVPHYAVFRRIRRVGHEELPLLSVYRDLGIVPRKGRDDNHNRPSDDLSNYQRVNEGDLVINKMKAWQGSVGVSEYQGLVSPAYFVYEPIGSNHGRFLHYLLRSDVYTAAYGAISKGIRVDQWDLDPQEHSRLPVLLPSFDEQRRIAAFLDHETARIDELVREQERLLALLNDRQAASIRSAIRGGGAQEDSSLSPESDWLGNIPNGWRKLPSRAVFDERVMKNTLGNEAQYLSLLAGIGIIRYEDKGNIGNKMPEDLSKCKVVESGDFVINSMNFGIGAFGLSSLEGVCSPVYVVLVPKLGVVEPRYAMRVFQDREFQAYAQSFGNGILAHRSAIGWPELKNIPLPIPPLEEQRRILARLDSELAEAAQLAQETQTTISLLLERRSALISAAVTGQLDLRNWESPEREAIVEEVA